jgi:hypothetical protein
MDVTAEDLRGGAVERAHPELRGVVAEQAARRWRISLAALLVNVSARIERGARRFATTSRSAS